MKRSVIAAVLLIPVVYLIAKFLNGLMCGVLEFACAMLISKLTTANLQDAGHRIVHTVFAALAGVAGSLGAHVVMVLGLCMALLIAPSLHGNAFLQPGKFGPLYPVIIALLLPAVSLFTARIQYRLFNGRAARTALPTK